MSEGNSPFEQRNYSVRLADKAKWQRVQKIVEAAARQALSDAEDRKECVSRSLMRALDMEEIRQWPFSPEAEESLKAATERCAAAIVAARRRRLRREVLETDRTVMAADTHVPEPISRDPGPERRAILADIVDQILDAVEQLTPRQQWLFVAVVIHRHPLAQLGMETGTSGLTLAVSMRRIRVRLRKALLARGISAFDVDELLNDLDRSRG